MMNSSNQLVSVIVPFYNSERHLSSCVNSISHQSYQNLEIILINDGSSDNSGQIADDIAKKDIRISVVHQKNAGVSMARNLGIKLAKGEFITFVDADDSLKVDAIDILVTLIGSHQSDLVRTNYSLHEDGRAIKVDLPIESRLYDTNDDIYDLIRLLMTGKLNGYVWLLLIRKHTLEKHDITFDGTLSMMEDTKFYINLFSACQSIYISDKVTYNYTVNTAGASRSSANYIRNINDIVKLNRYYKKYYTHGIVNLDKEIDAGHIDLMLGLIALQVESPSKAYATELANIKWLSRSAHYVDFYENANLTQLSPYARITAFFVRKKLTWPGLCMFILRRYVKRVI